MTEGSKVPLQVYGAGDTHIGGREHNEDSILLRPDLSIFVVADGAGGHNAGNVASTLAAASVAHYFESTHDEAQHAPAYDAMGLAWSARRLASAFQKANKEIIEISQSSESKKGMGSTLVAAYFDLVHSTLVLGHVGDSRCYRLRQGRLERMTQDHTLINDVLEMKPDIDADQAARLPRNVITNALGMDATVRVSVRTHEIAPGDLYVLCSDGLTDEVDDRQIQQALQLASAPEEAVRLLIDLAVDNGARDNVAVVVVGCKLAPGVGKLPESPVPPRRRHPEDAVLIASDDDDEESIEVLIIEDPDDADAPLLEITRDRAATDAGQRRRPDETIITKPDRD